MAQADTGLRTYQCERMLMAAMKGNCDLLFCSCRSSLFARIQ